MKRVSEAYWRMEKGRDGQEVRETFFIKLKWSGKQIKVCAKIYDEITKIDSFGISTENYVI